MDFLSAPSNFLVQWFRNFESKDLGPRFPSLEFSRTQAPGAESGMIMSKHTRHREVGQVPTFSVGIIVISRLMHRLFVIRVSALIEPTFD